MRKLMTLLRGGNQRSQPVDRTPPSPDTPEYQRAEQTVRAADRWLSAVMADADRVFKPHRRKPR